ncbi:MAG TPA: acetolactate synthase small subunit [Ktedonobacteraceae bacterium]|nr:acetolactate synthase small subunit [Ktedonobacteraceae bacterium]
MPEITNQTAPTHRTGHSNAPDGAECMHALIVLVEDKPGAIDRVVGVLRRRRANMQTLTLGRSGPADAADVVRISVFVNDSEVGIDHLVAQLRKIVDVQRVDNLPYQQSVSRELALIKVSSTAENVNEIIDLGTPFGSRVLEVTAETVTLEVTNSAEQIERLVGLLQGYGIRDVARSGSVAIARFQYPQADRA